MNSRRILWVEDDETIRGVVEAFAKIHGFDITFAETGTKALMLFDEAREMHQPFALVMMDIAMPDMAGHEVAARMRHKEEVRPASKKTRIVYCTAFESAPNRFQAQDNEAIGFISKPLDFATLPEILNAALRSE